jgi:hypothetical protein
MFRILLNQGTGGGGTPPADAVKPPSDVVKPPSDAVKPPLDAVKPPSDAGISQYTPEQIAKFVEENEKYKSAAAKRTAADKAAKEAKLKENGDYEKLIQEKEKTLEITISENAKLKAIADRVRKQTLESMGITDPKHPYQSFDTEQLLIIAEQSHTSRQVTPPGAGAGSFGKPNVANGEDAASLLGGDNPEKGYKIARKNGIKFT